MFGYDKIVIGVANRSRRHNGRRNRFFNIPGARFFDVQDAGFFNVQGAKCNRCCKGIVGLFVTGTVGMLSRSSWVFFRGGVDQQRHPGLLAVRVWVTGLGGVLACYMSLFATFEAGIDASKVRSFIVGKFSKLRRLSLGSEDINLRGGRGVVEIMVNVGGFGVG